MSAHRYNVLFLCTGNSARSIMAECILNRLGGPAFRAFSAGTLPTGTVNPYALNRLRAEKFDVSGLHSKSWEEFTGQHAPPLDFVFTVCDNAAGEACPVWPGQPVTAHWGLPDPAAIEGREAVKHAAFADTMRALTNRISLLLSLPLEKLDRLAVQRHLAEIGRTPDRRS